ncbi:MAG: MFS transporter [Calditrichia bacterium]
MNRTIKLLMISDIFISTGFGLIQPILAIFIKEDLVGGSILNAGIAGTIFMAVKSVVQLPFSKYVDKHDDKVRWLLAGTFLITIVPVIYIFARHIYLLFVAQVILGVGHGLAYPTWVGLWSLHMDRFRESYEWSLYSTLTGLGSAGTAVIGAVVAQFVGFVHTFILVGLMSLSGFFVLFLLEKNNRNRQISPGPPNPV